MSDVVITKTAGDPGDPVPNCTTITIKNFTSVSFELCTPVSDFPLPESKDTCNILVKAEGNRLVISVSWVLRDEPLNLSSECPPATKTVQEQLKYMLDCFQPQSIQDAYSITIDGITRVVFPRKWSFQKSGTGPITYDATVECIAGDVVAGES